MPQPLLFKGGTLLLHEAGDAVVPTRADLLTDDGGVISRIEKDIEPGAGVKVVDCVDRIVSPGFVDTHHHLWQTMLKGRHANHTLLGYFPTGNFSSAVHEPADMFWGQLSGCLEALDAGTTTVVDHAHLNVTPEHTYAALNATIASGLRTVFCYTPTLGVTDWSPLGIDFGNTSAPWVMETFSKLAGAAPFGDGRVRLGFAFDGLGLPDDVVTGVFGAVRSAGAHLITSHAVGGPFFGGPIKATEKLHRLSLLGPDVLLSHHTNPGPSDAALIRETGAHVSSTPYTELQMSHGEPVAFDAAFQPHASLGIDCHSAAPSSIPLQAAAALQHARAMHTIALAHEGAFPRAIPARLRADAAFNLCTVAGARAAGLPDAGTLAPGAAADIVVLDARTPAMAGVAARDPVAAAVLHAGVREVEAVVVGGVVRKEGGRLLDVSVATGAEAGKEVAGAGASRAVAWDEVREEVAGRQGRISAFLDGVDQRGAEDAVMRGFGVDAAAIVEE